MLKVLMLRSRLSAAQKELDELLRAEEGFVTREAELEASIAEASTEEERGVVEEAVNAFEEERSANTAAIEEKRGIVEGLEAEIAEAEETAQSAVRAKSEKHEERKENKTMNTCETRTNFYGMSIEQRDAFMAREEVKEFVTRYREFAAQQRSVTGAELAIPEIIIELLRENVAKTSKLLPRINFRPLKGKARQTIMGTIPEAVWTEAAGALNDLDLSFTQLELDGFKVGGFFAVPNSTLEDTTDIELLSVLLEALGIAIGKAVDKAILFGDGSKKPVGIITRLAASSQPSWWGSNQGDFTDLHTSNIVKLNINSTSGASFFATLATSLGIASPKWSVSGEATWVMNRKTHLDLKAKALNANLNGMFVVGINEMPVVGGMIIEDENMADYEICGGFMDCYTMRERAGTHIKYSDIPLMIQDQTLMTGTQRMDGKPSKGEAFVVVNYNNTDATTSKSFADDYANMAMNTLTVVAAAGTATGDTVLTVSDSKAQSGQVYKYKAKASVNGFKVGDKLPASGWTALTSGTTQITAAAGTPIAVVELDGNGRVVSTGSCVSVPKS